MKYECFGVNGFAGDRTQEAMDECHPFAEALSEFLDAPIKLYGSSKPPKDLQWNVALRESADVFSTVARVIKSSLVKKNIPILVTPRCAPAISSIPVVISEFPDAVVIYLDAHGDLNIPNSSETGYLGGMTITAVMGEWDSGYGCGLEAKNLVHIGGRDLEPFEHDFIRDNEIMTVSKQQIESDLNDLAELIRGRAVYIHIDTDVYDPTEVVAEYSVPDGLFRQHIDKVVSLVVTEGMLVGVEITELSPKNLAEREHSYKAIFDSLGSLLEASH
jgi:arginase